MKRTLLCLFTVSFLTGSLLSATNGGFGLDAFNRAVGAPTRGNAVFSPVSFEFDCVIMSEAFDPLVRARFAETMGVLNTLESIYKPIYQSLSGEDHAFSFLTARAFCLQDERKSNRAYRQWLQNVFSTEFFSLDFRKGAECWFHARLDGKAEDFTLPENAASSANYSFYDMVYFKMPWIKSFDTNSIRRNEFKCGDGTVRKLPFFSGKIGVDVWKRKTHVLVRMPMADNAWLYILTPSGERSVRDIRTELNSNTFTDIATSIASITEIGLDHGEADVALPIIDIHTDSDLKLPFGYFRFPMSGMTRMQPGLQPKFMRQIVRFQLDEKGVDAEPKESLGEQRDPNSPTLVGNHSVQQQKLPNITFDKPFMFFVHHEPTTSIPVVGQFTGL